MFTLFVERKYVKCSNPKLFCKLLDYNYCSIDFWM